MTLDCVGGWLCPTFTDLLTVSETANEPPQDEGNSFNSPRNLAMEATYINHNFSQQCLRMVSTWKREALMVLVQPAALIGHLLGMRLWAIGLSRTSASPTYNREITSWGL
jgi:hypothetical protein